MKRDTLTKTERRFAENCLPGLYDTATPSGRLALRERMKSTAYHEAAHTAARMFTGFEDSHVVRLSIIPNEETIGRETVERCTPEHALSNYPAELARLEGRRRLLHLLSGRGAEARIACPEERRDILDEDALWEQAEESGTDLFRALFVADLMARPGMPARRVLALAEKWTVEMLALPAVWRTVETLAGMLLERGTIEAGEIMPACDGIRYASMHLPKWRRRLYT